MEWRIIKFFSEKVQRNIRAKNVSKCTSDPSTKMWIKNCMPSEFTPSKLHLRRLIRNKDVLSLTFSYPSNKHLIITELD